LPAGELRQGDLLLGHDGRRVAVEAVIETREVTTVYNMRVAGYHYSARKELGRDRLIPRIGGGNQESRQ
jgi:hypothetical protein